MAKAKTKLNYLLCVDNKDCEDLQKGKVYPLLPDTKARREGYVRVIDESGEDYLYPRALFVDVKLPRAVQAAVIEAA